MPGIKTSTVKVKTSTVNLTWKQTGNQCSLQRKGVTCSILGEQIIAHAAAFYTTLSFQILHLGGKDSMSDCEQSFLVQEQAQLVHNPKLCKRPPSHYCYPHFKQESRVHGDHQVAHWVCLGQCNPIQH